MLLVHGAIFVDFEWACEADLVEVEGSFRVWEVGCESCSKGIGVWKEQFEDHAEFNDGYRC